MTKSLSLCTAQSNNSNHFIAPKFTVHLDNAGAAYLRSLKLAQSSPRVTRFVNFNYLSDPWPPEFGPHCRGYDDSDCAKCQQPRRFLSVPFFFHDSMSHLVLPIERMLT